MRNLHRVAFVVLASLISAMLTLVGAGAQSTEPACEGDYVEEVRALGLIYISALNAGDLDPWYEVLADDYQAFYPEPAFEPMDKEAARAYDEALMATFPGFQTEIHESFVSTDCRFVAFHWTSRGNFVENDNPVDVSGITLVEVADGQIVSERVSYDQFLLLTQMGLLGGEGAAD